MDVYDMNDTSIREAFHRKILHKYRCDPLTLVIDELGMNHGKARADISVLNSKFTGYEIKSDNDTLRRLKLQVIEYNQLFDKVNLITTNRHIENVINHISKWWGVILANQGPRGAIHFTTIRSPHTNPQKKKMAIARLLWKSEAVQILNNIGIHGRILYAKREELYLEIAERMTTKELQNTVRNYLIMRQGWRDQPQRVQYDDLYQPIPR